jgi:hypothetical protein
MSMPKHAQQEVKGLENANSFLYFFIPFNLYGVNSYVVCYMPDIQMASKSLRILGVLKNIIHCSKRFSCVRSFPFKRVTLPVYLINFKQKQKTGTITGLRGVYLLH